MPFLSCNGDQDNHWIRTKWTNLRKLDARMLHVKFRENPLSSFWGEVVWKKTLTDRRTTDNPPRHKLRWPSASRANKSTIIKMCWFYFLVNPRMHSVFQFWNNTSRSTLILIEVWKNVTFNIWVICCSGYICHYDDSIFNILISAYNQ